MELSDDEVSAQVPVISAAWRFLKPFYEDGNLAAAWPSVDPVLRLCWAQWWLHANATQVAADGHLDQVAQTFVAETDAHPLWPHFSRVVLRDFRAAFPLDPSTWGIGAAPRVLAPDTELLYVHRHQPAGGLWPPGATSEVVPLVMHLAEGRWCVVNLGYERVPVPGWPPALSWARPF